mmetsp:Transcript_141238/g.246254  ORF Transcript_141238/g.246254 Transcript_141238/m.246254 type:complete len:180 (+) Transcript_141238:1553-2092(+)
MCLQLGASCCMLASVCYMPNAQQHLTVAISAKPSQSTKYLCLVTLTSMLTQTQTQMATHKPFYLCSQALGLQCRWFGCYAKELLQLLNLFWGQTAHDMALGVLQNQHFLRSTDGCTQFRLCNTVLGPSDVHHRDGKCSWLTRGRQVLQDLRVPWKHASPTDAKLEGELSKLGMPLALHP